VKYFIKYLCRIHPSCSAPTRSWSTCPETAACSCPLEYHARGNIWTNIHSKSKTNV